MKGSTSTNKKDGLVGKNSGGLRRQLHKRMSCQTTYRNNKVMLRVE